VAVANGGTGAALTTSNFVFAGPSSGSPAAPSFRALTTADIAGLSSGSVTSVALALPSIMTVSGSPVTSTGTLTGTLTTQAVNAIFAGPSSGAAAAPTFRSLTTADIPTLNQNTTGTAANVTGIVAVANGGTGAITLAAASIATYAGTETLTNKRINPRVSTTTSTATLTPDISAFDQYNLTAQAASLTIAAPTGTPVDGNKLIFRLLDNGTARSLTWNATYTIIGVTLPTTTVINKTTYVGCVYNSNNTRWDVVAVTTQA
jgi:hypothetical protein